jgi:uncharacterized protein (DUF1015 family)
MACDFDGESHRVWVVDDVDTIRTLAAVLTDCPAYIADGHHRYETALCYRDEQRICHPEYNGNEAWNYLMMLLVSIDDPGLCVLPTHRLLNPRSNAVEELERLSRVCTIEPLETGANEEAGLETLLAHLASAQVSGDHVFGLYGQFGLRPGRGFALLRIRPHSEVNPVQDDGGLADLDVSILQELVLRGTFGLSEEDLDGASRVGYTRDADEAIAAVDAGHYRVALLLNPTRVAQVLAVARAGEVMPRKSTYFHPKPLTGLVLNRLAASIA